MRRLAKIGLAIAISTWPLVAVASQGPGGGPGTADVRLQLAMAIAVYGGAGLVIAAGLIGALRRPRRRVGQG